MKLETQAENSVHQDSMEMPGIWNTRDNWHNLYKENM